MVPAEELTRRLSTFDADQDGAITRPELAAFLAKSQVGGPWFCEVVAKTLWKYVEQRLAKEHPTIQIDLLGRIINYAMSRAPRPEKRYEITPEGMAGYKPLEPLKKPGDPNMPPPADSPAKPRATPRGPNPLPQRSTSTTPGRIGAAPSVGPPRPSQVRRPGPRRPGPRR